MFLLVFLFLLSRVRREKQGYCSGRAEKSDADVAQVVHDKAMMIPGIKFKIILIAICYSYDIVLNLTTYLTTVEQD